MLCLFVVLESGTTGFVEPVSQQARVGDHQQFRDDVASSRIPAVRLIDPSVHMPRTHFTVFLWCQVTSLINGDYFFFLR